MLFDGAAAASADAAPVDAQLLHRGRGVVHQDHLALSLVALHAIRRVRQLVAGEDAHPIAPLGEIRRVPGIALRGVHLVGLQDVEPLVAADQTILQAEAQLVLVRVLHLPGQLDLAVRLALHGAAGLLRPARPLHVGAGGRLHLRDEGAEVVRHEGHLEGPELGVLIAVPARAHLEEAPRREGFRATAWWRQTCDEILAVLRQTLEALAELQEEFVPFAFEARFGIAGLPPLVVDAGGDSFRVRGVIDRVDSAPGHRVRIIDYKTGGPSPYSKRALEEGKKLQAPLYALAARDALELGDPVDGFYWHVRHARRSGLTLRGFEGGPEAAMDLAVEYTWEAIRGIRAGRFVPRPPADGCPAWCAAAAFCWHHRPGFGG